jgi:hypothetical protein
LKQERITTKPSLAHLAAVLPFAMFILWLAGKPFNHDNAWLLEATRRWVSGEALYRDIIEINPPLIFLESYALSFGQLTKASYLVGVAIVTGLSAIWVGRWRGANVAALTGGALVLAAWADFGQRDHLALVFLTPFLLAPEGLSRRERIALGVWAFFGLGLKPQFLLIPGAYILAKESYLRAETVTLGALCAAWLAAVALIWPDYFTTIIPLGSEVYGAFGKEFEAREMLLAFMAAALSAFVATQHKEYRPIAAAALGAVACFLIQGRFWSYHLVPAIGLAAIVLFLTRDRLLIVAGAWLLLAQVVQGYPAYRHSFVPEGARSVLFLSDRVSAAYPASFECRVRNMSGQPTYWILPGAWNAGNKALAEREIAQVQADISRRPDVSLEDMRLEKYDRPFRFADHLDLSGYRKDEMAGRYQLWVRRDLARPLGNVIKCAR